MKALTVQQPYAWAIVHGGKDVENRPTGIVGDYRGPLAIHAGQRWSDRGGRSGLVWDALRDRFGWPTGPVTARDDRRPGFDVIRPLGAFIGLVDLVDEHTEHHCRSFPDNAMCSPWAETACPGCAGPGDACPATKRPMRHLVLANPRPLAQPIPCMGRLGLWTPPAEVLEQLREAL